MVCNFNNNTDDYYDDDDNNNFNCECNSLCQSIMLFLLIFLNCSMLILCYKCIIFKNNPRNVQINNDNERIVPPRYESIA